MANTLRARRFRAEWQVKLRQVEGITIFTGVIVDVSASGVLLQTIAPLKLGEAICMEISVPGRRTVVCRALITRLARSESRYRKYGASFRGFADDSRDVLNTVLLAKLREQWQAA